MWGIKRNWPFSLRCKKAGEEGMNPLGRRKGENALTAGSGCVVPRPSRVEVVSISTPAFGRRGAMDCAWEANTRLSLPMFGRRGAFAAILHFHVDSPPVSAFGGRALARTSFGWRGFLGAGGRGE